MVKIKDCFFSSCFNEWDTNRFNCCLIVSLFSINELRFIGSWDTFSYTDYITGTHWWRASLTNPMIVHQVELRAWSYTGDVVTVELYKGEELAGQCENHPGDWTRHTLDCDRVYADRVLLTLTSTRSTTWLRVYEIRVTGATPYSKSIGLNHSQVYYTHQQGSDVHKK